MYPHCRRLSDGVAVRFKCRLRLNPRVPLFVLRRRSHLQKTLPLRTALLDGPTSSFPRPRAAKGNSHPTQPTWTPRVFGFQASNLAYSIRLKSRRNDAYFRRIFQRPVCSGKAGKRDQPPTLRCERRQPPRFELQDPRATPRQVQIVRNNDRREPVISMQPLDQIEDAARGDLVQVAGRLVGQ